MKSIRHFAVLILSLLPYSLSAQAPAIVSVLNKISGDARLSPGVVAKIRYTPLAASDLKDNNSVALNVGAYRASTLAISADPGGGGIATVVLPLSVAPGPINLTITTGRGTSAPFRIVLNAYAPAFLPPWTTCAGESQIGIISGVGLGAISPPWLGFGYAPPGQTYTTVAAPSVTVAGIAAEVQRSDASPASGDYQIFFQVSPGTPEGVQPVIVTIGGESSPPVDMLVGAQHWSAAYEDYGPPGTALPGAIQTAPDSMLIASSCSDLFGNTASLADPKHPPAVLAGATVTITDAAGVERHASILSVSPTRVKYVVPTDVPDGRARVDVGLDGRIVSTSALEINRVQPFLFPEAYMYLVRIRDGTQTVEPMPTVGWFREGMIDLGPEGDQVYLVMPATGLRHRSSLENVILHIGFETGFDMPVLYAGPQTLYPGLDQVNVLLPRFPPRSVYPEDRISAALFVDGKSVEGWLSFFFTQTDTAK